VAAYACSIEFSGALVLVTRGYWYDDKSKRWFASVFDMTINSVHVAVLVSGDPTGIGISITFHLVINLLTCTDLCMNYICSKEESSKATS
jgi:hypothetical protein